MNREEIVKEAKRLKREADNAEYFATTLTFEHQESMKIELESKAKELRVLQREYERIAQSTPANQ